MVIDISGIRPDARTVGDVLFEKLKGLIDAGKILREHPLHLIGHSAGGFVVERAAIKLVEAHSAPSPIHVTILDTPGVDQEILFQLPGHCSTDFYRSSWVGGVATDNILNMTQTLFEAGTALLAKDFSAPHMHFHALSLDSGLGLIEAHQNAYKWFEKTISDPDALEYKCEGFNRSPILKHSQQCDDH